MKTLKIVLITIASLVLLLVIFIAWGLNELSESELREEQKRVEGSMTYNFNAYPKAFDRIYELTKDFPNIHQLRFFDDGQISFVIKHCQEDKTPDDYCIVLEISDTSRPVFQLVEKDVLLSEQRAEEIRTRSWVVKFTGSMDHPQLESLLNYLQIDTLDLHNLNQALGNAHVGFNQNTQGYTKNSLMATFGIYSMLASMDYIIPLKENLDVDDYSQLDDRYYYGQAPTFSNYYPD